MRRVGVESTDMGNETRGTGCGWANRAGPPRPAVAPPEGATTGPSSRDEGVQEVAIGARLDGRRDRGAVDDDAAAGRGVPLLGDDEALGRLVLLQALGLAAGDVERVGEGLGAAVAGPDRDAERRARL